ncbi:xanthine dehydrogenase [Deinococcus grandis]|uniref:Xanthine dehydrogenase n=1 Tax=Deinococcus grandis TaxID=57498 RepID=A0A100HIS9_9DEIO|nr:xanthine dehydrogenase family protein [Deinococcus grandis]BBN96357.1 hypothetical protein DEGR_30900 [Deinococcus grandis]GAQ20164.1 xanthine dehydrogenase [Deinococcus grandis]
MTTPELSARTHLGRPRKIIDGLEKLVGRAPYVADRRVPGLLHAREVLSPYPHSRIRGVDRAAALAVPGVKEVLLGADLNVKPMHSRPSLLLAGDTVVFAGQPVALILADTEAQAADAAALLDVDYEMLDAVEDAEAALANAVREAAGVRVTELPVTAEAVWRLRQAQAVGGTPDRSSE